MRERIGGWVPSGRQIGCQIGCQVTRRTARYFGRAGARKPDRSFWDVRGCSALLNGPVCVLLLAGDAVKQVICPVQDGSCVERLLQPLAR